MARTRLVVARLALALCAPIVAFAACETVGWLAGVPLLADEPSYRGAARMDRCHSAADAFENCAPERLARARGRFRVAFLGGSSVFGYPAGTPSFVPRVGRALERAAPGKFRVFNYGLYCKDTLYVRACADRLLGPDLDLLVIYAGHNDFANWMGRHPRLTMFVERNAWVLDLRDRLARTRTYSFVASLLREPGFSFGVYARPPLDVFRETSRTILDAYRANLEAVLDRAAAEGVPVLLVTLVSNLYEHPYQEADWDAGLVAAEDPDPVADWRAPFARGVAAQRAGRPEEALAAFAEARDALPLGRAPSAVNEIARELAATRDGVSLVDFERILVAHAAGAPIGCAYFGGVGEDGEPWCDQFHPAPETHGLLADALVERIRGLAQRIRREQRERTPRDARR